MNGAPLQNANPTVYAAVVDRASAQRRAAEERDESMADDFDEAEVFDMIRHLNDPEHPLTLEQLKVLTVGSVALDNAAHTIDIRFTPTIPHCSMATLIGLCIRVKLIRSLPTRFKVTVSITPGTHASEHAVNKQLNDKERVAAALENNHLLGVVNKCIAHTDPVANAAASIG